MLPALILASLTFTVADPTPLANSIPLSSTTGHRLEYQQITNTTSTTLRICTPFAGWNAVGFNPVAKVMQGAELYQATKVDDVWQVDIYEGGSAHSLGSQGFIPNVVDVRDAAVECATSAGVEFTRVEV
jgi:hypothetical protein